MTEVTRERKGRRKPKRPQAKNRDQSNMRDRFQTPSYALAPLLKYIPSTVRTIWEPCAGDGFLVQWLQDAGYVVEAGDVLTGQNYFHDSSVPKAYDMQVTNPPYSIRIEWAGRACELGRPWALLMPVETLALASMQRYLIEYKAEIIVFDARVDYLTPLVRDWSKSAAQFPSAWFTVGLNIGERLVYEKLHKDSALKLMSGQLQLL